MIEASRGGIVAIATVGVALGCTTGSVFLCESADDCQSSSASGICQTNGYCSFPDESCPSGQRYGDYAGGSLAGECVPASDDTDGVSTGPDPVGSSDGEAGPTTGSLDEGTTDDPPSTESSGGPACGGLDQPCCDGSCDEGLCTPRGCASCSATVKAGEYVTCAVRNDGELSCWGLDAYGQVGDGLPIEEGGIWAPTAILSGATQVDIGAFHACALAGGTWCWGRNDDGQLGLGVSMGQEPEPVALMEPEPIVEIAAGGFHTCALGASGAVYCWGRNADEQLGTPEPGTISSPVPVEGLPDMVTVDAGGFHSCAIDVIGAVWCWGQGADGQLGRADLTASEPEAVVMLPAMQQLALGDYHTCALDTEGRVWCWGRNDAAQLAQPPSMGPEPTPMMIEGIPAVDAIASGDDHVCAWTLGGESWCWGRDGAGQVGGPLPGAEPVPVPMPFSAVRTVAGGRSHTCATESDGTVWCMGNNAYGQLGDGSTSSASSPVPAAGPCSG